MANGSETAPRLLQALQDSNRSPIFPGQRLQMAALFAPSISTAVGSLERNFLDATLPLSLKLTHMAEVCAGLHEELAIAYKLVVHDLAGGTPGVQNRQLLAAALFHAIGHLADGISQAALVYQDYPPRLWQELHGLFSFAERNDLTSAQLKVRVKDEDILLTLRDRYAQALLFATASPHRLRQREMYYLRQILPKWARLVRLSPLQEASRGPGHFLIQLSQDLPPVHASLFDSTPGQPTLILDTQSLLDHLEETFDRLSLEIEGIRTAHSELSKTGVKRLMEAWGTVPKRRFLRTHLNFDLNLAVGLSSIHRFLNDDGDACAEPPSTTAVKATEPVAPAPFTPRSQGIELSELDWETDLTLIPLAQEAPWRWQEDNRTLDARRQRTPPPPLTGVWKRVPTPVSPTTNSIPTLNESIGGYCVDWEGSRLPGIKVGELVGIQLPTNKRRYALAVVRWIRSAHTGKLQVGLQLIAPNAQAVTATSSQNPPVTMAALLVDAITAVQQSATLITPILPLSAGQIIFIEQSHTRQKIRLLKLLESTGAFAQFEFERA